MSESKSWRTPATIIGMIALFLTAAGVYINNKTSDLEVKKLEYQRNADETDRLNQDQKNGEIQNRIAALNSQLQEAQNQIQNFEDKIQKTYRQIQDYDFKQNDPEANEPSREASRQSYLIARENLEIFSNSKRQYEEQVKELRKEINGLIK
jgi:hypothetical protein